MSTNSKTLRFAIFGNEYQPKKSTAILTILSFLEQRGAEIYIDRPFYEFLQLEHRIDTKVSGVFDGNNFDVDYVISMGGDGLFAKNAAGETAHIPCPKVTVANATGGGDAMAAALAACITQGRTLEECARLAIGAGALACTSEETIHPGISWENINYILNKEDM